MWSITIILCLVSQILGADIPEDQRFKPSEHENWKLLQNRNCGGGSSTGRITGGVQAGLGEFPWIAGILKTLITGVPIPYVCSGSILNQNTVLTAAHCVYPLKSGDEISKVVVGDWDKSAGFSCVDSICAPRKQVIPPKEIIIHIRHRDYSPNDTHQYDIALVRLKKDIEYNSYVFPICILDDDLMYRSFVDSDITVAGWGIYKTGKKYLPRPGIIHKVGMKVKENDYCDGNAQLNYVFHGKQMCLASENKRAGTCFGDGGGPVMLKNETSGRTYIIGIISERLAPCNVTGIPTIATRVGSYMEWILDNLAENVKDFLIAQDGMLSIQQ